MKKQLSRLWPAAGYYALAAGLFCFLTACVQWLDAPSGLKEGFKDPSALESNWVQVISGDFAEANIDVVGSPRDKKLRLRASTLGTEPKTVKFLGIRSREAFEFRDPLVISWVLGWNEQRNSSYLSAGLLLSPHEMEARPTDGLDWLQVSYVGVPPGKNARLETIGRFSGNRKTLFSEGWPTSNRLGRRIGLQKLELHLSRARLELKENGRSVFRSEEALDFEAIYVYLFLTSHSNYGPREVYFDNVTVRKAE